MRRKESEQTLCDARGNGGLWEEFSDWSYLLIFESNGWWSNADTFELLSWVWSGHGMCVCVCVCVCARACLCLTQYRDVAEVTYLWHSPHIGEGAETNMGYITYADHEESKAESKAIFIQPEHPNKISALIIKSNFALRIHTFNKT